MVRCRVYPRAYGASSNVSGEGETQVTTLDALNVPFSQKYLAATQATSSSEATELVASLAAHFAKEISSGEQPQWDISSYAYMCTASLPAFCKVLYLQFPFGSQIVPRPSLRRTILLFSIKGYRSKRTGEATSAYVSSRGAGNA